MSRWNVAEFNRELTAYLKTHAACTDDVENFILMNYERLPSYYTDRYCHLDNIRKRYEEHDVRGVKLLKVSIDDIIGQGWVFKDNISPRAKTLAGLIITYLITPDALFIQAIFAMQLPNGKYFVSDGSHRIYAAYLLGITELKLEIDKYAIEKPAG